MGTVVVTLPETRTLDDAVPVAELEVTGTVVVPLDEVRIVDEGTPVSEVEMTGTVVVPFDEVRIVEDGTPVSEVEVTLPVVPFVDGLIVEERFSVVGTVVLGTAVFVEVPDDVPVLEVPVSVLTVDVTLVGSDVLLVLFTTVIVPLTRVEDEVFIGGAIVVDPGPVLVTVGKDDDPDAVSVLDATDVGTKVPLVLLATVVIVPLARLDELLGGGVNVADSDPVVVSEPVEVGENVPVLDVAGDVPLVLFTTVVPPEMRVDELDKGVDRVEEVMDSVLFSLALKLLLALSLLLDEGGP